MRNSQVQFKVEMSARVENESEILLGNKQLLVVFGVVAVLIAFAFTGGYMLGKRSTDDRAALVESAQAASGTTGGGPVTHKVIPDDTPSPRTDSSVDSAKTSIEETPKADFKPHIYSSATSSSTPANSAEPVLGERNSNPLTPHTGQTFVQVMAVSHRDAEATAEVLRQHDFKARTAPAPGNPAVFRVLVGPTKDAADLRSTEDALRKIGYTKCFPQHY